MIETRILITVGCISTHVLAFFVGVLRETTRWFTGKEFEIVETECRVMGAPACIWRIGKTPQE